MGGAFGRGSIFKISHTKRPREVQNLDPRADVARAGLQMARWVYEGGESGEGRQRAEGRVAARCGGSRGRRPLPPLAGPPEAPPATPPPHPPPAPGGGTAGPARAAGPPPSAGGHRRPCEGGLGGGAICLGAVFSASRFLKSPILNRHKKFRTWTLGPMWRARACIWPGGSMKGKRRHQRQESQWAPGEDVRASAWAPLQAQRKLPTYPSNSYRAALEQLPTVCRRFCR